MNDSGTEGWAIGADGMILHYGSGQWQVWPRYKQITTNHLVSMWMNDSATEGWAVGVNGIILRYDSIQQWKEWGNDGKATSHTLSSIWMNSTGSEGWAAGDSVILHFAFGHWEKWEKDGWVTESWINDLEMKEDGTEGWAVGVMTILHYSNGQWEKWKKAEQIAPYTLFEIWLNDDLTHGWAVGDDWVVLQYIDGQWEESGFDLEFSSGGHFSSVWMNAKGTEGWMVGSNGSIFKYINGHLEEYIIDQWTSNLSLNRIWMNDNGLEGWMVGSGIILRYSSGKWEKWKIQGNLSSSVLSNLWFNEDATEGWAISYDGTIFRFHSGKWEELRKHKQDSTKGLCGLWLNTNGTEGWACGDEGLILHFYDGQWKEWEKDQQVTRDWLSDLWLNKSGKEGWAVGGDGVILRYDSEKWVEFENIDRFRGTSLYGMWINADGVEGWACGRDGLILHYQAGQWKENEIEGQVFTNDLYDIWLNDSGSKGWAVGDGAILCYATEKWKLWTQDDLYFEGNIFAITMDDSNSEGWAVGSKGLILRYYSGKWEVWDEAKENIFIDLHNLFVDNVGMKGWIVGDLGRILYLDTIQIPSRNEILLEKEASLEALSGNLVIHLGFVCASHPRIELIENATQKDILNENLFTVKIDSIDKQKVLIRFHHSASEFAFRNANKPCTFRLIAQYGSPYAESARIIYESDLVLGGQKHWPWWWGWLFFGLTCVLLNILAVVFSIWSPWARRIMFHPYGLPLVVGKYIYIGFLLRFVKPVRRAFFKGYRRNSRNSAESVLWAKRSYIPPTINGKYTETKWQLALKEILQGTPNHLFSVIGSSGLGKTALLEKWKIFALELGLTPFLVRLSTDLSPVEEIAAQVEQHGDLALDSITVFHLLKEGGFLILLDGLNEDSTPDRTREFVRQVVKRNIVVISSQTPLEGWDRYLNIQPITINRFGRDQLIPLIGTEWADRLLATPSISDLAELPHTAHLTSRYLQNNGHLPKIRLDIYRSLRSRLDEDGQMLNLELKGWEMYIDNTRVFESDEKTPKVLCDKAVESGILTRREGRYMFQHDRLHHFFVACYLVRQDDQPLVKWFEQVRNGMGRAYWANVIEFLGEIYAERAVYSPNDLNKYKRFILEVVKFEKSIYRERIYPLLSRLREQGGIALGDDFMAEIAVIFSLG